jgi:hypothetical protein
LCCAHAQVPRLANVARPHLTEIPSYPHRPPARQKDLHAKAGQAVPAAHAKRRQRLFKGVLHLQPPSPTDLGCIPPTCLHHYRHYHLRAKHASACVVHRSLHCSYLRVDYNHHLPSHEGLALCCSRRLPATADTDFRIWHVTLQWLLTARKNVEPYLPRLQRGMRTTSPSQCREHGLCLSLRRRCK